MKLQQIRVTATIIGLFGIVPAMQLASDAIAGEMEYGEWGLGGHAAFGSVETEKATAEGITRDQTTGGTGGLTLFGDAMMYDADGPCVLLWEIESAARLFGGYSLGDETGGFGGAEIRGNGDIGGSFAGILPINQAVEDTKLSVTNRGFEGKTLLGTTHVLPIGDWVGWDSSHRALYVSLSHGFRIHSEIGGWTWALQPKVRLLDLRHARMEARYLFGFWHQNRREHSGSLALDFPLGDRLLVSAFGEAEYLQKARAAGNRLAWTGMVEVTAHFLDN